MTEITKEERVQQTIERFWEAFPPSWNRIIGHVRQTATQNFEVTLEQFHILRHIRRGMHSSSELAEVLRISRPAVSQALDALVQKGLVTRQQSAEDRRYIRIDLTDSGARMMESIFSANRAWMKQKMAGLPEQDLNCLMRAMDVLQETFVDPAG